MGVSSKEDLELLKQELRGDLTPQKRAEVELKLGRQYARSGAHDQGLLHLTAARRLFDQTADRRSVGEANAQLGATCGLIGEPCRATIYIERALSIADEIGDAGLRASALNHLGEQAFREGEFARAHTLWSRARSHFEEHGDKAELAVANTGLALILAAREQYEEAATLASRAADDAESSGDQFALGRALIGRATVYWKAGDPKQAKRFFRRAIAKFHSEGYRRELAESYLQFGLFMGDDPDKLGDGHSDPPAYWLAKAQGLFRELGGLHDIERVRDAFRNFGRRATDEERVLGAVNAVVLERENIRSLLELTRSLSRVESFAKLPNEIANMAAQLSNADRALLALADDAGEIQLRGAVNFENPEHRQETLARLSELVGSGADAQLLFRPDDPSDDDDDSSRSDSHRLHAALGFAMVVPLRHGQDLCGVIYADNQLCGGGFTERDLDLAAVFAEQAAVVLENGRIQEERRVQGGATAATLEVIRDGVVSFDGSGTVTSVNRAGARITGIKYDPKKPSHLSQLPGLTFLRPSITRGEEFENRTVNLPTGEYLCAARVVLTDNGGIARVVAAFTERKRATSIAQKIVGSTARYSFADIIGSSTALKRRLVLAEAAARSDSSVLITGESGTGKELFAQAIHNAGPRVGGPFVGINCAAIPRDLLESELFGYESGAFTGARRGGRPGKFELAEGGTILLDEIGDMPLEMQAKLLRVLQEKVTQRLGGAREIELNCRIVGTTNRDLSAEVARGLFRQDLYFRLRVIHIDLPPLRTRPEDIEVLADHFLKIYAARLGKAVHSLAPHVMTALRNYPWPGNIRELEHVLEGEVNLAADEQASLAEVPIMLETSGPPPGVMSTPTAGFVALPQPAPMPMPVPASTQMPTAEFTPPHGYPPMPTPPTGTVVKSMSESERELLVAALAAHHGNIPSVARSLGVSRGTVYNKMKKFKIDPGEYRGQR